jgi:hypothetical protein
MSDKGKSLVITGLVLALLTSASITVDTLGTRRTFQGFNGWFSFFAILGSSSYIAYQIAKAY